MNNWNPWINSNWLACALLIEKDEARRAAAVYKILRSLDRFIVPYPGTAAATKAPDIGAGPGLRCLKTWSCCTAPPPARWMNTATR